MLQWADRSNDLQRDHITSRMMYGWVFNIHGRWWSRLDPVCLHPMNSSSSLSLCVSSRVTHNTHSHPRSTVEFKCTAHGIVCLYTHAAARTTGAVLHNAYKSLHQVISIHAEKSLFRDSWHDIPLYYNTHVPETLELQQWWKWYECLEQSYNKQIVFGVASNWPSYAQSRMTTPHRHNSWVIVHSAWLSSSLFFSLQYEKHK